MTDQLHDSDVADWLAMLPRRMQSTTLMGLRGPDNAQCPNIKALVKRMRKVCLKPDMDPNDPDDNYMLDEMFDSKRFLKELEYCTVHYAMHLLHSVEIIGYMYPTRMGESPTADFDGDVFYRVYHEMVEDWHLKPEPLEELDHRLRSRSGQYLSRA